MSLLNSSNLPAKSFNPEIKISFFQVSFSLISCPNILVTNFSKKLPSDKRGFITLHNAVHLLSSLLISSKNFII